MKRGTIVVGASGDIGRAIALALHTTGRRLFLTHSGLGSFNADDYSPLLDDDSRLKWATMNLLDKASVESAITQASLFLEAEYDLVVASGIVRDAPMMMMRDDLWDDVIATNLTGVFRCLRTAARDMTVAGSGNIVLLGSTGARVGNPGQGAYAASKAGLEALCRVAAVELGRFGIAVNVVAPGPTESRMFRDVPMKTVERAITATPTRRLTRPEEVAEMVVALISQDAGSLTGQTIVIDGGMTIAP